MDIEFIIPVIVNLIGIFTFIFLLIRVFLDWAKSSNNKAKNGLWEKKTNHLFYIIRIVFLLSFVVFFIGDLIFMDDDWGFLFIFGFLLILILSKIKNN